MQETRVQSLSWEVPLENEMAIHSSILAWIIPWTEKPVGLQSMGSQKVIYDWATNRHTHMDVRVGIIKKVKHQRIDAFELWCWRRLLRVPWTARRSNKSILKEISPEYSLEGLMLKLKLQYFGYLMQGINSLEKTLILERLKAGGEGDNKGWDGWIPPLTRWEWVWVSSRSWWETGKSGMLQSMGSQTVRQNWATELK